MLSVELNVGFDSRTPRPQPELKPRVRHSTTCATQAPLFVSSLLLTPCHLDYCQPLSFSGYEFSETNLRGVEGGSPEVGTRCLRERVGPQRGGGRWMLRVEGPGLCLFCT